MRSQTMHMKINLSKLLCNVQYCAKDAVNKECFKMWNRLFSGLKTDQILLPRTDSGQVMNFVMRLRMK